MQSASINVGDEENAVRNDARKVFNLGRAMKIRIRAPGRLPTANSSLPGMQEQYLAAVLALEFEKQSDAKKETRIIAKAAAEEREMPIVNEIMKRIERLVKNALCRCLLVTILFLLEIWSKSSSLRTTMV